jgi:hypothetical protein
MKYRSKGEFDALQVPFDIKELRVGGTSLAVNLKKGQWIVPSTLASFMFDVMEDAAFRKTYQPAGVPLRTVDPRRKGTRVAPRRKKARTSRQALGSSPLQQTNGEDVQRITPHQADTERERAKL